MVDVAVPYLRGADVVAILTRAPASGGKSRLFADLARPVDRMLLEAMLLDTIDSVRASKGRGVLCVDPASEVAGLQRLVPDMPVVAQPEGTLGDRMAGCMQLLFTAGAQRVALIGSDLPTLSPTLIDSAFAALDADPGGLVIGPARDGGYFLVAAGSVPPIFDDVRWSTSRVCAQTVDRAAAAGWRTRLIETIDDIDTADSLRRAEADAGPRTRAWILAHLT